MSPSLPHAAFLTPRAWMGALAAAAICTVGVCAVALSAGQDDPPSKDAPAQDAVSQEAVSQKAVAQDPEDGLAAAFGQAGILFDAEAARCGIPMTIEVTNELLEYLVVAAHGKVHEAMLLTTVDPVVLNTALQALGATPGTNAQWVDKDPAPSDEELANGVSPYDVVPPVGDSFYLYLGWREGEEVYFFRVEDMVRDISRGRTMRRQPFVYLGSHMTQRGDEGPEIFAAAQSGNLINISFFAPGDTLLTASAPECVEQTIWLPNAWLLPQRGNQVLMVFSRERLDQAPTAWVDRLPEVEFSDPEQGR